jgi:ribosomal protein L12E/L44/L45/RPP1/RPP2
VSLLAKLPLTAQLLIAVDPTIKMKHLAAYLLLGLAGNTSPSDSDIKGVLQSVGIDADEERLEKLLSELKGKDINEVRQKVLL